MIPEVESRAQVDQIQHLHNSIGDVGDQLKTVKVFTSDSAQAARKAELETLKKSVGDMLQDTEVSSRLVRACFSLPIKL